MNPRAFGELLAAAAAAGRRHRRRRGRRAGLPQHHRRGGRAGPARGRHRGGRCDVRPHRALAGEKINLEFISANPTGPLHLGHIRWAVARRRASAGSSRCRGRGQPGVLLQRPRRPDGPFARSLDRGRAMGDAASRGWLQAATTSPTSPRQVVAADQGIVDLPDDERADRLPRGRRTPCSSRNSRISSTASRPISTSGSPSGAARERRRGRAAARAASRPRPHLRAGRRAVDAHDRLRRRQGPGPDQVQRRAAPTSPATPPTTSTSGQRGFDR